MTISRPRRRGPIGWLLSRTPAFWICVALLGLPGMYVASIPVLVVAAEHGLIAQNGILWNILEFYAAPRAYTRGFDSDSERYGEEKPVDSEPPATLKKP
jgi:hypothetical protein